MITSKKAYKLRERRKEGTITAAQQRHLDEYEAKPKVNRGRPPKVKEPASGAVMQPETPSPAPPSGDPKDSGKVTELGDVPEIKPPPPIDVPKGEPTTEAPKAGTASSTPTSGNATGSGSTNDGGMPKPPPPQDTKQQATALAAMVAEGGAAILMKWNAELASEHFTCFSVEPMRDGDKLLPSMAEQVILNGFRPALFRLFTAYAPKMDQETEDAATVAGIGAFIGAQKFRLNRKRKAEQQDHKSPVPKEGAMPKTIDTPQVQPAKPNGEQPKPQPGPKGPSTDPSRYFGKQ